MWITCNDAINRYDGKTVKVYNLDKYFANCTNLQQGYGFAEDNKTNVYIGSTKGLYIYNRQKNSFTVQKIFSKAPDNIAIPIGFRNGKIYCVNRLFQLASYEVDTHKIEYLKQFIIPSLASIHVYQLNGNIFYNHFPFIDKNNNIWIIGNNKIQSYNIQNKQITDYLIDKSLNFYSSFYDADCDRILIGTQNCILIMNLLTNKIETIKVLNGQNLKFVNNICASKDKVVFTSGIDFAFATKNFSDTKWFKNDEFLNSAMFFQLSFDKSERLWVCDDGKGEIIFDFHTKILNKYPNERHVVISELENPAVTSFAEFENGNMLIQGRILFNKKNNKILYSKKTDIAGIATRTSTDNFRKGIWAFEEYVNIKQNSRNIYFFDNTEKLNKVIFIDDVKNFGTQQDLEVLSNHNILCSFVKGLFWLNPESKTLDKVIGIDIPNPFKINNLSKNRVAVSYICNDMLVAQIMPNNHLKIIKKLLQGIQSFYIQEDTIRNRYWLGTNQGIYLLDKNFETIKKFDANNGLAGTYIYGLLLDNDGNVFCSHQRGLSSINAKTFQVINFDKNDGIQDWDFNNRSFYKAIDGTMYFGGVNGFNYFKPPLKPFSFYKPEVYIDEILINDETFCLNKNHNFIKKLELNFNQNNISIKAIVKDLANANSLQLIYRFKEIDKKWKYLKNSSPIEFNNLAPNNYTLQLGYYDKYTNKEIYQKTLIINICAPFYSKFWFWSLVTIFISALIFWYINNRKVARKQIILHEQLMLEQQRNRITADLHDDIGATLSSLQINSSVANQLINKNPVEAQKVLEKIEIQSQNLADKIGDIIWSMKPGKDEFMTMSSRIKNFANEILGSTDINFKIKIDKNIDTIITDITTRKNIVLIIKEAINNVAKYSQATDLKVLLSMNSNILQIEIIDNGIGFDVNKISGNGISNMKKRILEINGKFIIISDENGTQILAEIIVD